MTSLKYRMEGLTVGVVIGILFYHTVVYSKKQEMPAHMIRNQPPKHRSVFTSTRPNNSRSFQNLSDQNILQVPYKPIELTEGMPIASIKQAFISLVHQKQIECKRWSMYGNKRNGGWPVCTSKTFLPKKRCIVYSFGINYDWSFDEAYREKHGCTIRTFDPSMGNTTEHEHKPGVMFYPIGLAGKQGKDKKRGWQMNTYSGFLRHFKEEKDTISYLKFDIERWEWGVLANLLEDGSLKNVMQLSFEIHVDTWSNIKNYFQLVKGLETQGFRRWFQKGRGGRFLFQSDQSYVNINFLNQ